MKNLYLNYRFILVLLFSHPLLAQPEFDWVFDLQSTVIRPWRLTNHDALITDEHGNLYHLVLFQSTIDVDPGSGVTNLVSNGSMDFGIVKYDSDKNLIWAKTIGGAFVDWGNSIDMDASSNLLITGQFQGTVDFDPGSAVHNITAAQPSTFILKLDTLGQFIWVKSIQGIDENNGIAIKTDSDNNVYVLGEFRDSTDFDPGAGVFYFDSVPVNHFYANNYNIKLDSNGNFLWANYLGYQFDIWFDALLVDDSSNVYAGGNFWRNMDFDPGPNTHFISTNGPTAFVSMFNQEGEYRWTKSFKNTTGPNASLSWIIDMALGDSGNVFLAGHYENELVVTIDTSIKTLVSNGLDDIFIAQMDSTGSLHWLESIGGESEDLPGAIAVDDSNNVYCTGYFTDSVDFDWSSSDYSLTTKDGSSDMYILKASESGVFYWATNFGLAHHDQGLDIEIDNNRNIYAFGQVSGLVDFDPSPWEHFYNPLGLVIHKMSQCFTRSNIDTTVCGAYIVPSRKDTLYSTGVYRDYLTNYRSCDSIIEIKLQAAADPTFTLSHWGDVITSNASGALYQWLDCDNGYAPISGATAQSFKPTVNGSYAVRVEKNGCIDTSGCYVLQNVGLADKFYKRHFSAYPNPHNSELNISLDKVYHKVEVRLFNALGQITFQNAFHHQGEIKLQTFGPSGMYILEIQLDDEAPEREIIRKL